jgi:transcriptional regulator with XRE-family HTH domain
MISPMKGTASSKRPPRSLADAIRRERKDRGWSQSRLARELGTTEQTIRNWESGKKFPNHPTYQRVCLLFGWPLPYSGDRPNPGYAYRTIGGTDNFPAEEPALAVR